MKFYNSIVPHDFIEKEIFDGFPSEFNFLDFSSNLVKLNQFIACAAILCPAFVEYNGMIFLEMNVGQKESKLSHLFGLDSSNLPNEKKQSYERENNLLCLSQFYCDKLSNESDDRKYEEVIDDFGAIIIYFWKQRLNNLFPEKEFNFILKDDLYDEEGLCLTFYSKEY